MKQVHALLVVTFCSWLTPAATAQVAPENATNFAMIGITRGQSLQINLVAYPPDPCFAQIGFQNSGGNPIGTTSAVTLQPGQSASLVINGKRELSKSHIRKLSARFRVDPGLFF